MRIGITGVAGWQKTSFIDFPGTVSTVLFFSGCNLACPYCHNPDILRAPAGGIIPSDELWDFLEKRRNLIDGVVLSGGEPTLHSGLVAMAGALRDTGYRVKLDTNGMLPAVAEALAPDYLALDIKTAPRLYKDLVRTPYDDARNRLEQSVGFARRMAGNAEVRVTVAPGIVDGEIIREIGELVRGVHKLFLQPVRVNGPLYDPSFADRKPAPDEEILRYRSILAEFVHDCVIRGQAD